MLFTYVYSFTTTPIRISSSTSPVTRLHPFRPVLHRTRAATAFSSFFLTYSLVSSLFYYNLGCFRTLHFNLGTKLRKAKRLVLAIRDKNSHLYPPCLYIYEDMTVHHDTLRLSSISTDVAARVSLMVRNGKTSHGHRRYTLPDSKCWMHRGAPGLFCIWHGADGTIFLHPR
ncbi:hypothetical protein B0H34DRAFT_533998 [Crassisporium funariophilum]|nr:hypothetical protein B0H34DRAFT_533998 [Crassisporium funariophilum]